MLRRFHASEFMLVTSSCNRNILYDTATVNAPVNDVLVTSLVSTYQRTVDGGVDIARQLNTTVSPTVAFTDRGLSDHCGLPVDAVSQKST